MAAAEYLKQEEIFLRTFNIHPINLIKALSMALELAVTGVENHHWRVAVICDSLAECLDLAPEEREKVVYAALLHDIGAAANASEKERVRNIEESAVGPELFRHAEAGYDLLKDSPQLGRLADIIRHHHDRWIGGNPGGLAGEEIPLGARLLHLADKIALQIRPGEMIFTQNERIEEYVEKKSGTEFDPALVAVFKNCAAAESFWLDMMNQSYQGALFQKLEVYGKMALSLDDALEISEIFATIIDSMSRFTAKHSQGVARVASLLAELKGFSASEVKMMRIAGLLHDLGKLAVPNSILEKPDRLTKSEVKIVRQHTYFTYRILEQIDSFEQIAEWAAFHHECLDGTGYPFRLVAAELSLGSRIVAVADVFVALSEDRPYSGSMPQPRTENIMEKMVENNKLDSNVTALLFKYYDQALLLI